MERRFHRVNWCKHLAHKAIDNKNECLNIMGKLIEDRHHLIFKSTITEETDFTSLNKQRDLGTLGYDESKQ